VNGTDQFHVGIVVDDVDATLSEMTALHGYEWCNEIAMSIPVWLPDGDAVIGLRMVYSRTTPRVEIVQSIPGTVWHPVAGSGIHHLGYWSDDVQSDRELLRARGYHLEAAGISGDGATAWAYLHRDGRPRIELVSRSLQEGLQMLWDS
jgi:hypothetical protein